MPISNCESTWFPFLKMAMIKGSLTGYLCLLIGCFGSLAQGGEASFYFEQRSTAEGLSHPDVYALMRDAQGFLWVGTGYGLNRYDGYQFQGFIHDRENPKSLSGNEVHAIIAADDGFLWVGSDRGLDLFDTRSGECRPYSLSKQGASFVLSLAGQPGAKVLWVGTEDGLFRLDVSSGLAEKYFENKAMVVTALHWDNERGGLWIGSRSGLFFLAKGQREPHAYTNKDGSALVVLSLEKGRKGQLWVATEVSGLLQLSGEQLERVPLGLKDAPTRLLEVVEDELGNLWVGSWSKGIYRRKPGDRDFVNYRYQRDRENSPSHDSIHVVFSEGSTPGAVWFGTDGGGLNRLRLETEAFTFWGHTGDADGGLSDSHVFSILEDRWGFRWVGTWHGGLDRMDPLTGRADGFRHEPGNPNSLPSNTVCLLFQDSAGMIWVGASGGLSQIDRSGLVTRVFEKAGVTPVSMIETEDDAGPFFRLGTAGHGMLHFRPSTGETRSFLLPDAQKTSTSNVGANHVFGLYQGERGPLWAATGYGLFQLDAEGEVLTHFLKDPEQASSLPHNLTMCVVPGSKETGAPLWIGTQGGLSRFDRETSRFRSWRVLDGLVDDTIYGILVDHRGWLWLSTNNGISCFDPVREVFRNFGVADGLPNQEFNTFAFQKSKDGRFYFGGVRGLIAFYPDHLTDTGEPAPLVLSGFQVNGQARDMASLQSGEVLPQLNLEPGEDVLALSFASLDFTSSPYKRYAFQLEGWDKDWVEIPGDRNSVIYSHLKPGTYQFRLKSTARDGVWGGVANLLQVRLKPGLWQSGGAKLFYGVLLLAIFLLLLRFHVRQLAALRAKSEQSQSNERARNEFLANTSHELRTPVHGIIGMAESMMDGGDPPLPSRYRKQLEMMVFSGRRLVALVEDLLDFSQLEQRQAVLDLQPVGLSALVDAVLALCRPLARDKSLVLVNQIPEDFVRVHADEGRLHQVFINLVGNAVKFTESGAVTVSATLARETVTVQVKDTGIGIARETQDLIFQAFRQAEGHTRRIFGGSGLGLSICKKLVGLHGGEIWVESDLGAGSSFFFTLSVNRGSESVREKPAFSPSPAPLLESELRLESTDEVQPLTVTGLAPHHILVVDDDPINRQVLFHHLQSEGYQVSEASDGVAALALIEQHKYDLVMLDMMMPNMSGIDVCRKVRESWTPSTLPIIFLSARDQEKDRLKGLEAGANDYLIKPVSKVELLMRIRNQLRLLESSRDLEQLVKIRTNALKEAHEELNRAAHQAGMGELAAEMMHRMGNTLNSFSTSLQVVEALAEDEKTAGLLARLERWFLDPAGEGETLSGLDQATRERLAAAMTRVSQRLAGRTGSIKLEMERVRGYTHELNEVLQQQQEYARERENLELCNLGELLGSALDLEEAAMMEHQINLLRDLERVPRLMLAPRRFSRLFGYLLDNAHLAVCELGLESGRWVKVSAGVEGPSVVIAIRDNGAGFNPELKDRLFVLGFSTRAGARGFGLHYCANAINEMGGQISLTSRGTGQGALVRISFPIPENGGS